MQQKPSSPFEELEFHGNSITLDVEGKILVLPTGDPDVLPMYNERTLDPKRDYTWFGSYNGSVPDYCPGTIHCQTEGVVLTDPAGGNSGSTIGAGVLKHGGYLTVDTDAHTISTEFDIVNIDADNDAIAIATGDVSTGWSFSQGTGTISVENGRLKIIGNASSTGYFTIQKNISYNLSNDQFLRVSMQSSVNGNLYGLFGTNWSNYYIWSGSVYSISTQNSTTLTLPINKPVNTTGTPNKSSMGLVVVGLHSLSANASVTLYIDLISRDTFKITSIETFIPSKLAANSLSLYTHNGTAYQLCSTHSLNDSYSQLSQTSTNCTFLNGTKLDDVYGSAGAGRAVYPKGSAGETKAGSSGNITYSSLQGAEKRIGFMVQLPPASGNFSIMRIKTVINYITDEDGIYSTTTNLVKSSDTSTGLENIIKPYLIIYDPDNTYTDVYLFSQIPESISFKKDENGNIYELTLTPSFGSISHGKFTYPDLELDFDYDGIPNVLDSTVDGSLIKSLFQHSAIGLADFPESPVIEEVVVVTTPGSDPTPQYTFSSTKAGRIKYINCSSTTKYATVGNNTITFDGLELGEHSDCKIIVYDKYGVSSNVLSVTAFTIESPTLYIVPAITDTKILPATELSESYIGDTIEISASPGEYTPASFVLKNVNDDVDDVEIIVSDLSDGTHTINNENIDVKIVKCWWQAGSGNTDASYTTNGRYLTPELLLNDETLINIDDENWSSGFDVSNVDGINYLKINGNYVDISDGLNPTTGQVVTPIADRPISDAINIQKFELKKDLNKQIWVTTHIPTGTQHGIYTGTISIIQSGISLNTINFTINVLPIELLSPDVEYSIYYRGYITTLGSISSEDKTEEQFTNEMINLLAHGVTNPTIYTSNETTLLKMLEIRQNIGMDNSKLYLVGYSYSSSSSTISHLKSITAQYGVDEIFVYGPDEQTPNTALIDSIHAADAKVFCAEYIQERADPVSDRLDLVVIGNYWPTTITSYHEHDNKVYLYNRPQTIPEYPRTFRLNYGLKLWQNDLDGAMDYAYQHSFRDIWNDFDSSSLRDHVFSYPTMDGVIDTIQWEGFREGVTDMRYLATLQAAIAENPTDTTAIEAQSYLNSLKTIDLSTEDLDVIRSQVANYIIYLTTGAHRLTVLYGAGSGFYVNGENVEISSNVTQTGVVFSEWGGDSEYVSEVDSSSSTVMMPNTSVEITGAYTSEWANNDYLNRKQILINPDNVSANLENFPLCVDITDTGLKTSANGGNVQTGYDFIFVLPDGTVLNYELISYDNVNGNILAWVRIPTVSDEFGTFLYIYYGNSEISTSQENVTGVWDNNYKGVWHLDEIGTGAVGDYKDATINDNDSVNTTTQPSHATGIFGGCSLFNGSDSVIQINDSNSLDISSAITISAWINPSSFATGYEGVVYKGNTSDPAQSTAYGITNTYATSGKTFTFIASTSINNGRVVSANSLLQTNKWQYISATYDSATGISKLIYNGILDKIDTSSISGTIQTSSNPLRIGKRADLNWVFTGYIAEVRVSNIVRSDGWIETEYANQYSPSTFYVLGDEEEQ